MLVEVVQDDFRHFAALQLDDDAHALAIGLVAKIGNAFDGLFADQLGDLLDQPRLVHLVGNLGDDDRLLVALLRLLDRGLRAHQDRAAAGPIRGVDARASDDEAAGRKIGALHALHQAAQLRFVGLSSLLSPRLLLSSMLQMTPSMTSRRLCGGTLVAMPTAMPDEPFTSRLGIGAGRTVGSSVVSS